MTNDERAARRIRFIYATAITAAETERRELFIERISVALVLLLSSAAIAVWLFWGPL